MKILGYEIRREQKGAQFETVLDRIVAAADGTFGTAVTPETCMQSPTVQAIVKAISDRIAVTPVHVYKKGTSKGRETKERLGSHPVARLLQYPNAWQTRSDFFADAASALVQVRQFLRLQGPRLDRTHPRARPPALARSAADAGHEHLCGELSRLAVGRAG